MRLYEIANDYQEIQRLAEDDESMIEAVADTLDGITGEFEDKAQAVVAVATNTEADIDAIDAQIKRLQDKKKTIKARADWLRDYLKHNMDATGIDKIQCPLFTITLSKPTQKAEITDEKALPDDYVVVKTEFKPDKREILKALKEGKDVPGAALSEGARRLIIK